MQSLMSVPSRLELVTQIVLLLESLKTAIIDVGLIQTHPVVAATCSHAKLKKFLHILYSLLK